MKSEAAKEIYFFQVPSSTEWNSSDAGTYCVPPPNVFVDISETLEKRIEALKAYKSESRRYPHPRSLWALEIIARLLGMTVGRGLVEAFRLVRWINEVCSL